MRKPNEVPDEFEQEITHAMQRVDAPETLARFLAAAAEVEADRGLPRRERRHARAFAAPVWLAGWRLWAGTAVAATLLGGVFVAEQVHQQHEAERAQRQFHVAIGITNHALDEARAQLERAGVTLAD